MTAAAPLDPPDDGDAGGRVGHGADGPVGPQPEWTDDQIDLEFSQIVSGLTGQLDWDDATSDNSAEERRRRREARRAERAQDLWEYQQAEQEIADAHAADTEHFVPPIPPPLPRPRGRTVLAGLLFVLGVVLMGWPELVEVNTDVTVVIAGMLIVGAGVLVATGLRRWRGGDDDDDDGAVV